MFKIIVILIHFLPFSFIVYRVFDLGMIYKSQIQIGEESSGYITIVAIIVASIAFVLQHFFEDADHQRKLAKKIRAKYIWPDYPPSKYLDLLLEPKYKLAKDYLSYRLLKIHYAVVYYIIFIGIGLLIAVLSAIWSLSLYNASPLSYAIIAMILVYLLIQVAFSLQFQSIARRLSEINAHRFHQSKLCFDQEFKKCINPEYQMVEIDNNCLVRLTKATIWINQWFYKRNKRCYLYSIWPLILCLVFDAPIFFFFWKFVQFTNL